MGGNMMNIICNKKILVFGLITVLIGASVVSSTGYIAIESNPSEIYFKMDSPTVLLDENFSGTFPPEGWETGFFGQNNSSCCDSEPPCARGEYTDPYYDDFMMSKAIDASNYEKCIIKFYFGAHPPFGSNSNAYLKFRRNETSSWIDITPWANPIDDVCEYYETEITYAPEGCGEALQIMWQYLGYYYYFVPNTCIDDVEILGIPINNPPSAPTIHGPSNGGPGENMWYEFNAVDPDGDDVRFYIEWGDCTYDVTEYVPSGTDKTVTHTWEECDTYIITACAIDTNGNISPWTSFWVAIPRDKTTNNLLLLRILERFPLLHKLILSINIS
jgi:hypothetical protein